MPESSSAVHDQQPSQDRDRVLLVSVARAGEILSLSRSSIYQLIWTDQLTPVRIGRSVRFSIEHLESSWPIESPTARGNAKHGASRDQRRKAARCGAICNRENAGAVRLQCENWIANIELPGGTISRGQPCNGDRPSVRFNSCQVSETPRSGDVTHMTPSWSVRLGFVD